MYINILYNCLYIFLYINCLYIYKIASCYPVVVLIKKATYYLMKGDSKVKLHMKYHFLVKQIKLLNIICYIFHYCIEIKS